MPYATAIITSKGGCRCKLVNEKIVRYIGICCSNLAPMWWVNHLELYEVAGQICGLSNEVWKIAQYCRLVSATGVNIAG